MWLKNKFKQLQYTFVPDNPEMRVKMLNQTKEIFPPISAFTSPSLCK